MKIIPILARATIRALGISACVALALILDGCAFPLASVSADARPATEHAYIAGRYEQNAGFQTTAFQLRNLDTDESYLVPFSHERGWGKGTTETSLIEVTQGRYTLVSWRGLARFDHSTTFSRRVDQDMLTFEAKAGEVTFLGSFSGEYLRASMLDAGIWQWQETPIGAAEARDLVSATYPNFVSIALHCVRCVDSGGPDHAALSAKSVRYILEMPDRSR